MPRVVSIYLPNLATDRIRQADPTISVEQPIAVIAKQGSKRWVSATDHAARTIGVRVGMPAAKAQAIFQGLMMLDADSVADSEALERITFWALAQYTPIVAVDGVDGIVMDTAGADHLKGGEAPMLSLMAEKFSSKGLNVRIAISDTWAASHACARAVNRPTVLIPPGQAAKAVERLSLSLLRLPADIVSDLGTLGFKTISDLWNTPRAPLTLRFGPEIGRRLDQVRGILSEPIDPLRVHDLITVSRSFVEPIGAAETIDKYVGKLVVELVSQLEKRGLGVRCTDLLIHRVDNTVQAVRAGTAKPARDVAWLTRLFKDRTSQIEPGFGIEKLELTAIAVEPLNAVQKSSSLIEDEVDDIAPLIDILGNRGQRIYRFAPFPSDLPERSVKRTDTVTELCEATWPSEWPRPARLLRQPEIVDVIALLPDQPPVSVTWRGKRRRIKRADGPERVFGEWWKRDSELQSVRDYFIIEDEIGERLWIFRSGDGVDLETGSHKWFVHGIFA